MEIIYRIAIKEKIFIRHLEWRGDRSRNLMATGGCIGGSGAATSYTYEVNGGYVTKAVGSNGGSIEYVWE